MRVFVFGFPGRIGGASTELAHTVKLWRKHCVNVHLVPTWGEPSKELRAEMESVGAVVHVVNRDDIATIPLLADSPVVSFCNSEFLPLVPVLRGIGCPLVWSNCMSFLSDAERECTEKYGPFDAYHFQSNFQRESLEPYLKPLGYKEESAHLIRGAFSLEDWEFTPRSHGKHEPFVMGKLARSDTDKWAANLWDVYGKVLYREKKALVMGLTALGARKLGNLPRWAEWLKPDHMDTRDYYRSIHCLFTINGGSAENWPRVGLEAMAAGVPIVTEARWGWLEMIEHGVTGFLGETDEEMAFYASALAHDETLRMNIARQAREKLGSTLARPSVIWEGWQKIFRGLGA